MISPSSWHRSKSPNSTRPSSRRALTRSMSTSRRNPVRSATRSARDSEDQPPAMPTTPILSDPLGVRDGPAASVSTSAKQHLSRKTEPLWRLVALRDHHLQYVATFQKHLSD